MTVNLLSVSGGKDSTACIAYCKEHGIDARYVFADTENEHHIVYEYLDYLERYFGTTIQRVKGDFHDRIIKKREYVSKHWFRKIIRELRSDMRLLDAAREARRIVNRALGFLHPTGIAFLDLCIWKGRFPSTRAAFCTIELKQVPIRDQGYMPILEAGEDLISIQGVRRDESERRKNLARDEYVMTHTSGAELSIFRPIIDWSAEQVFDYHRKHGIKPNPLYSMGMRRVGCMPCINCGKDELLEITKRFPEYIEKVRQWEESVSLCSKRGLSSFFLWANNTGRNIDEVVEWAKTSFGGKQYDMYRALAHEESTACRSIYGLCE